MPEIHPTAIVDSSAELAGDVVVGPYCVIGRGARIGAGTTLGSHVVVQGKTTIGRQNAITHHVVLGGLPQDLKYRGGETELVIGDHNEIREFVTVHLGTEIGGGKTTIGHRNLLMVGSHIAHDSHIADRVILANNVLLAGHVSIEDCAVVSGGAAIHHFVAVGKYAFVGGNSGVVHDCPPYMVSDGHPARVRGVNVIGLQRHRFDERVIERLKYAYKLMYKREEGNQADGIDAVEAELGSDPIIAEVCGFARRAGAGPQGRHHEAQRRDNKRQAQPR